MKAKPVPAKPVAKPCSRNNKIEKEWARRGYIIDFSKLKVHDWFKLSSMLIHKSEVKYCPETAKYLLRNVYNEIVK